jgi:hypothetical protein
MENKLVREVKILRRIVAILISLCCIQIIVAFREKNDTTKFEEIDVERINIVEKDGTLKLALFNSSRLKKGLSQRQGEGSVAGMLFYNEEGHECGGLTYRGKKIDGGQQASAGLMFDGYRQDQTVALQHIEYKDSVESSVHDGLTINYRPDRSMVKQEYQFYKFIDSIKETKEEKDSMEDAMASQGKIMTRRLFIGTKRGTQNNEIQDETGLYIKNRLGKDAIRLYVDKNNTPHLEMLDSTGKIVVYELDIKKKGES